MLYNKINVFFYFFYCQVEITIYYHNFTDHVNAFEKEFIKGVFNLYDKKSNQ